MWRTFAIYCNFGTCARLKFKIVFTVAKKEYAEKLLLDIDLCTGWFWRILYCFSGSTVCSRKIKADKKKSNFFSLLDMLGGGAQGQRHQGEHRADGLPRGPGDLQVPQVLQHQARAGAPLLGLPEVHPQDGPPLPLGQQLRRGVQPEVLRPLHGSCCILNFLV